ncbi:MAG TPA: hypothetical protein VFD43_01645 [Planctomycetota bacterium]|nr:hypothetical protein [Planctomycetota bacterium]
MAHRPLQLNPLAVLTALAALAAPAAAGVWTVGPSGADFTQIGAAVAAARDGDLILVEPSGGAPYAAFTIDGKSLAISIAHAGDVVEVRGVVVKNLAAGQSVTVRGFLMPVEDVFSLSSGAQVLQCAGAVRLEDCTISGSSSGQLGVGGMPAVDVSQSADVGLTHCTLQAGYGASSATNDWDASSGGPGLRLSAATAWVHESELRGGNGGNHDDPDPQPGGNSQCGHGGPGALLLGGSTLTLAGSTLVGGEGGAQVVNLSWSLGGPGVTVSTGSLLRERDNTYLPGDGTMPHTATPEILGGPAGVLTLHPPSRELLTASPLRAGGTASFLLIGDNGDLNVAPTGIVAKGQWHQAFAGPLLIDPQGLTLLGLGVTPASGQLQLSFTVPPLPASLDHLEVHMQLATVHDGVVTLENGSTIVLLDSAF